MHRDHRKIARAAHGLDGPGALESNVTPGSAQRGRLHTLARLAARRPAATSSRSCWSSRSHRGMRVLERRPMPPLGHFSLIRVEWLPEGTDGRGRAGAEKIDGRNALDTAVPNDPASLAPSLLARDPSRVVIHLASAVFGLSSGSHSRSWSKRVPQCHGARWRRAISRHNDSAGSASRDKARWHRNSRDSRGVRVRAVVQRA
jgi:hypothetical protein